MDKKYDGYKKHSGQKVADWISGAFSAKPEGVLLDEDYYYDKNFNLYLVESSAPEDELTHSSDQVFYAGKLKQPIVVEYDTKWKLWRIVDGNHRAAIAKQYKIPTLPAFVRCVFRSRSIYKNKQ